ncbi:MAG: hypothetical protein Q9164_002785 [Protoblastenia rupestris]
MPGPSGKSEDLAICLLFTQVAPNSGLLTQTIVDLLSPLYVKASPHPVVIAATKALAMDHLACSSANPMHKPQALSAHVRALKTMNKTLQSSSVIESNESVEAIILSILALCLRQTWASIEYADPELLNETNACTSKASDVPKQPPMRTIMLSLMRNILLLRAREKALKRGTPGRNMVNEVMTLLDDAKSIDAMITVGAMSTVGMCRHPYRIEFSPYFSKNPSGPELMYIYGDVQGAIFWIRLRSLRLMTFGVMVRAAVFLERVERMEDPLRERLWAEEGICKLVDEICSSHAYCFDYEDGADQPKCSQRGNGAWTVTPDKTVLAWDLTCTLQMACEFNCVPFSQRGWMQQQVATYKGRFKLMQ